MYNLKRLSNQKLASTTGNLLYGKKAGEKGVERERGAGRWAGGRVSRQTY
jgi:hypothetical protein